MEERKKNSPEGEDEQLIRSYCQGNRDSFRILFEKYYQYVYRSFVFKGLPPADAEDYTQDIFMKLIKSLKNFKFLSSFRVYLLTIIRNKLIEYYRKKSTLFWRLAPPVEEMENVPEKCWWLLLDMPSGAALRQLETREFFKIADLCLEKIKDLTRRLLMVLMLEGYKRKQMAALAGIPLGSVHSHLERGKHFMQHCIQTHLDE